MTRRDDLQRRMEDAAAAMDFETAARLRDQISLLPPDGDDPSGVAHEIDTSRMRRQQPGAMGIGTSEPGRKRPEGWTPPPRPDPMTSVVKPRKHRRR